MSTHNIYHRIVKSVKIQTSHMIYKVHASGMVCSLYSSQINKQNKSKYIKLLTVQKWIDMIGFEMCLTENTYTTLMKLPSVDTMKTSWDLSFPSFAVVNVHTCMLMYTC